MCTELATVITHANPGPRANGEQVGHTHKQEGLVHVYEYTDGITVLLSRVDIVTSLVIKIRE